VVAKCLCCESPMTDGGIEGMFLIHVLSRHKQLHGITDIAFSVLYFNFMDGGVIL
jgi:hypothetical protein